MTPEQLTAAIAAVLGLPIVIDLSKRWLEGRNLKFQTEAQEQSSREDREWKALQEALNREREFYARFIADQRVDFTSRLVAVEQKLGIIQQEAEDYQKLYWEERVKREGLQTRVDYLERQLLLMEKIAKGNGPTSPRGED